MFRKKQKPEPTQAGSELEGAPVEDKEKETAVPDDTSPQAEDAARSEPPKSPAPPAPPPPQRLVFDESELVSCYANFCRVTGTPEEVILDFALNVQPIGAPTEHVKGIHRLIVNYYTAKRMLAALHVTISRHEQTFGVIQTDVQKRAVPPQPTR